ncbi:hypothetical protein Poly24_23190 [Rosistilla carotiformis]|uniref:DUF962 domain-containing protein n=1 Tax=Rosistilla carotiformis TaxID=2528017 RepID=A0A518JST9_9BACT|nr:Mpo1-like protein [Rosistilla carotiformis]QDV68609.1 hypothetical protein Poly24_23190 [Rosistilla carotiformis]
MAKKTAADWFAIYEVCHRNPTNERIHWICVPLIAVSFLGMLWGLPAPHLPWGSINWSVVAMVAALVFYIRLSLRLAVGMATGFLLTSALFVAYQKSFEMPLWIPSFAVFVVAWLGQFIGHKIEGAKPAFFQDLQFLLIGPAWVLDALYRRLGW